MTELEERKLQAEIDHIKAQTAKVDAERKSSQRSWRHFVVEGVKVVGAVVIGVGGFMAAFTGYQLAEVKKEKTELANERLKRELAENDELLEISRQKKLELNRAVAAAQGQLDTTRQQLKELQTQLVAVKRTAPASADTSALDAAITRTNQIRADVNAAKTELRSTKVKDETPAVNQDVETRVRNIFREQLGVNPEQVTPQATLVGDLGADELDVVELVMACEQEFGIQIPDEDAESFKTVGDFVAYLRRHPSTPPAATPSPHKT
ncbi:MAG TPA: acyl carrier protein [Chthoniobacterales bacterium]|nr:acyl carrier protein [Chthoniobacterales bacterium]